jgi:hypothetical protein
MFIPLFGLERELHDPSDTAELLEEVILTMIERSKRLDVDDGDVASLLALELAADRWGLMTARHCR